MTTLEAIEDLKSVFTQSGTLIPSKGRLLDMSKNEDVLALLGSHLYRGSLIGNATKVEFLAAASHIIDAAVASKSKEIVNVAHLAHKRIAVAIRPLLLSLSHRELAEAACTLILEKCNCEPNQLVHRFADGFSTVEEARDKQKMLAYIEQWLSALRKTCHREDIEDYDYVMLMMQDYSVFRDALVEQMTGFVDEIFEIIHEHCEPIY